MSEIRVTLFDAKPYDIKSFDTVRPQSWRLKYQPPHLTEDTVLLARDSDAVCVFVNDRINAEVIRALERYGVKLIALRCAGYNNVDLKAAYRRIHTVRVPAYSPYSVAEHAVAMILALNRRVHRAYYRIREGNFNINGLLGFDLHGKTAGIVGTGRIGRVIIEILRGFGMRVLAYDAQIDPVYAASGACTFVDLDALYAESDIISLHCPLTPQTQHMIDAAALAKMKPTVMIINTSRGRLIDTQALIDALKAQRVGFAGLDVYEEEAEYFFEDFSNASIADDVLARLMTFNNVLITSHQAFFTAEALEAIARTTVDNIEAYFGGGPLPNEICYHCGEPECAKRRNGTCF